MSHSTKRILIYILIPVIGLLAGIFYYVTEPQESVIMPKCIMKLITGYQCPSCGTQRALHALLHGHFWQALHYNYFCILSIPLLLIAVYACYGVKTKKPPMFAAALYGFVTHRYTLIAYIILFFVWWIVRNGIGV